MFSTEGHTFLKTPDTLLSLFDEPRKDGHHLVVKVYGPYSVRMARHWHFTPETLSAAALEEIAWTVADYTRLAILRHIGMQSPLSEELTRAILAPPEQ